MSEKDITAGFAKKVNIRRLVLLRFNKTCTEAGDADTNGDTPGSAGIGSQLIICYWVTIQNICFTILQAACFFWEITELQKLLLNLLSFLLFSSFSLACAAFFGRLCGSSSFLAKEVLV